MTKSAIKRTLLVFVLAICLVAGFAMFVACNGDDGQDNGTTTPPPSNDAITYTVEVKLEDGGAALGTTVAISAAGVTYGNPIAVNEQGKATFELPAGNYDVTLDNLTEHYDLPADASLKLTATGTSLTVTLVRKFAYVVNLKTADDKPLAIDSVTVGICTMEGNCLNPVPAVNGKAIVEAAKGDYHVKIFGLPAEYAYVSDENFYYTGEDFSATKTEMTITVDTVNVIDITKNYLTAAQKTELSQTITAYNENAQKFDAVHVTKTLAKGESAYYVISPRFSGEFNIYATEDASYQNLGNYYRLENSAGNIYAAYGSQLPIALDDKQYIRVYNDGEETVTASFIVTVPAASETVVTGVNNTNGKATAEVIINKSGATAILEFRPTSLGAYKLTVKDDVNAAITTLAYKNGAFDDYDASAEFTKNPSVTYKATDTWSDGKNGAFFAVSLPENATVPATLTVEIERIHIFENTVNVVAVQETLTKFATPDDKELVGVPMDGSANLVYNETDKFYHLGAADGPVVVVMLTELVDESRFADFPLALAYLDMDSLRGVNFVFDKTTPDDIASLEKGNTYKDYRTMLRGFTEYAFDKQNNPMIPEEITAQTYYAKYVNDDGVYPLTKELEAFLKDLLDTYSDTLVWCLPWDVEDPENFWLFPLYYYGEATEADVITGEYKFVSGHIDGDDVVVGGDKVIGWDDENECNIMGTVTDEDYKLTVNKNGTFVIEHVDGEGFYESVVTGTWSKSENTYTFTEKSFMGDTVYTVTFNAETGEITITSTDEWIDNSYSFVNVNAPAPIVPQPTPIPTPDVTPQTVPSSTDNGKLVLYDDQANQVGVFKLYVTTDGDDVLYADGNWGANQLGDITISNLQAFNGATVTHSYDKANNFTLTVVITYEDGTAVTLTFSFAPLFMQ